MTPRMPVMGLAALALLAGCGMSTDGPHAKGGGLEGETLTLSGVALYPDGSPAASAQVRVRSSDATGASGISEERFATTDAEGRYSVPGLQAGEYYVITEAPGAQASFQEVLVAPVDSLDPIVPIQPDTVKPLGSVRVRVAPADGMAGLPEGSLQIVGLGRQTAIDSSGVLLVKDVPPGTHFIRIVYASLSLSHRHSIAVVTAGDTLELGPYTLNPGAAEDLSTWKHSLTLRLNATSAGVALGERAHGFQALVRLDSANFPFEDLAQRYDGSDIRFTDARGKRLPFEIEYWDGPGRKASLWVRLDTVHVNREDTVRLLYGKADVFSTASPRSAFDTADGINAAWHFAMYHAGGSLSDATANRNQLRMAVQRKETGVIWQAWSLVPGDELGASASPSQEPASLTLSGWFKPKAVTGPARIAWKHRLGEAKAAWSVTWLHGERVLEFALANGASPEGAATVRAVVPAGKDWNHFAATYDAKTGKATVYVNGKAAASKAGVPAMEYRTAGDLMLGSQPGGTNGFKGALDEMRLYRYAWTAGRAALEYENTRPGAALILFPVK